MSLIHCLPKKEKWRLTYATLISLVSSVVLMILISFVKYHALWAKLTQHNDLYLYAIVLIVYLLLDYFAKKIVMLLAQYRIYHLKKMLIELTAICSEKIWEKEIRHEIQHAIHHDTHKVSIAYKDLAYFISNVFTFLAILAFTIYISQSLFFGMSTILVYILTIGFYLIPRNKLNEDNKRQREQDIRITQYFLDLLHGTANYVISRETKKAFLSTFNQLINASFLEKTKLYQYFIFVNTLVIAAVFILIGTNVSFDQHMLQKTFVLTLFIYAHFRFVAALVNLPGLIQANQTQKTVVETIDALKKRVYSKASHSYDKEVKRVSLNHIILEDVHYAYAKNGFELGPIHLTFKPSHIYFITGPNGCGKSTLVNLLLGKMKPTHGQLYLNEMNLNTEQHSHYFSAVTDDIHLSTQIPYFLTHEAEAQALLKSLNLDKVVSIKKACFDRVDLSRGQKRRLALVVSHVLHRPVMIFDEWAANQDIFYKKWFYHDYLPRLKNEGVIAIVITHDEHYFPSADKVIYLSEGKVIGSCVDNSPTPTS